MLTSVAGPLVLIGRRSDLPGVRRLVEGFAALGAELQVTTVAGAAAMRDAPGLLLCRLPSGTPAQDVVGLLEWERRARCCVNRPSALLGAHDKGHALSRLAAAGVAVPPTARVTRHGVLSLERLPGGGEFVVKPITGAAGRGVVVGHDRARALACAAAFAEVSGPVLVQPRLGDGTDRRVLLAGDRVIAAMERTPGADGRGSLLYGAEAVPWEPDDAAIALARRAASALRLDIAAVDLLHHDGASLVLEVNACPGLAGIESATGRDLARELAGWCLEQAQNDASR